MNTLQKRLFLRISKCRAKGPLGAEVEDIPQAEGVLPWHAELAGVRFMAEVECVDPIENT